MHFAPLCKLSVRVADVCLPLSYALDFDSSSFKLQVATAPPTEQYGVLPFFANLGSPFHLRRRTLLVWSSLDWGFHYSAFGRRELSQYRTDLHHSISQCSSSVTAVTSVTSAGADILTPYSRNCDHYGTKYYIWLTSAPSLENLSSSSVELPNLRRIQIDVNPDLVLSLPSFRNAARWLLGTLS